MTSLIKHGEGGRVAAPQGTARLMRAPTLAELRQRYLMALYSGQLLPEYGPASLMSDGSVGMVVYLKPRPAAPSTWRRIRRPLLVVLAVLATLIGIGALLALLVEPWMVAVAVVVLCALAALGRAPLTIVIKIFS